MTAPRTFPQGAADVQSAEQAAQAAAALDGASALALDLEADSMHAFRARLCFIQAATDDRVFLFDTLAHGVDVRLLAPVLSAPSVTKFLHAGQGDLQFLAEAQLRVQGLFDTHRAATLLGLPKVGLADLVQERMGVRLAKEHQQDDFSIRPLPPELRAYIADDVRYLCALGRELMDECRSKDILEEVQLDCERMCAEAAQRPALEDFRPKLPKGGVSATQQALAYAIAKALHASRLRWAEKENLPMGRMLSNAALTELSTSPPSTLSQLKRTPGVRGPFVRTYGEEVLALVQRLIQESRDGALPPPPAELRPDAATRKRLEALKGLRGELAARRGVTASVVLPNALMEALAKEPPRSAEALATFPYFGPKRMALHGEAILAALFPD